jgi:hypothetical protein
MSNNANGDLGGCDEEEKGIKADPYYPEEAIRRAFDASDPLPKPPDDLHKLNLDHLVPLSLQRLHFVIIGQTPAGTFRTLDWTLGSNISTGFLEESDDDVDLEDIDDYYGCYYVLDVDIQDANGKIFATRVVYNKGDGDANTGFWGKVFDRETKSVLADLKSTGDCVTTITSLPHIRESFQTHDEIYAFYPYLDLDRLCPGTVEPDDHFAFLVGLAIAASRNGSVSPTVYTKDRVLLKYLQRLKLCLLGKPEDDSNHLASTILCGNGPPQNLIAEFLADDDGQYVPLSSSSSSKDKDSSLDGMIETIWPLLSAIWWWRQNDRSLAMKALGGFKGRVENPDDTGWVRFDHDACLTTTNNDGREIDFTNEKVAEEFLNGPAKALTLGWSDEGDEAFFSWVAQQAQRFSYVHFPP